MSSRPLFQTVSIIGLGLIGGSFAKLIRHHLPETTLFALDQAEILEAAKRSYVIDDSLDGIDDTRLYQSDLIVLGTHVYQSMELLQELAQRASGPIRVMDLGSTKESICAVANALEQDILFIGGHPLAGREVSGFANSRWDLFHHKRFLLTPCRKTTDDFQNSILLWLKQLETTPIVVEAHEHDRLMGLVSHFPQFYAVALANLLEKNNPQEALLFLGGGIDDQMRLMASPYDMWKEVFKDNKANVAQALSQFIVILQHMQQDLANDNLSAWFDTSHGIYQLYQDYKIQPPLPMAEVKQSKPKTLIE